MNTNTSATRISGSNSDINATDYTDIAQDFVALAPSLQERNQSLFNSANQASLDEVHGQETAREVFTLTPYQQKRNQDVITSTDMAFLNAVHDQDISRAEENDFEAFMAPGSVHSISNSLDVRFDNNYTEPNEAEYNDSNNSNDYSYESVHGYLRICNPVNINTLPIESDFVTKNVNQESHVPFYEPNTYAEAATLELFYMFVENNISRNVFDKCIKIVNKYMAERGLPATNALLLYYKMDKILKDEYTVCTATYDMCMESCIRFRDVEASNLIDEEEQCSHCGSQWFRRERDTLVPVQTFKVVHLLQQLRFKLENSQERAKMAYDVFNGGAVRRLCEGGIVGQDDILVTMFVDQFNPFDNTKMLATIIHVVNLNIDPKERDIESFLEPIIEDFRMLATLGIQIQTVARQINVKVHLVMATACLSKGVSKHHTMCFFGDELPVCMRTVENLRQFEGNSYGVNGPNVFRDLSTLTSSAFFGLNEMYLLGHSIGKQLHKALGGKFQISPEIADNGDQQQPQQQQQQQQQSVYTFALNFRPNQIDRSITKFRADISAIFTGSWQSLEETTSQLVELPSVCCANGGDLVKACTIAQQWKVTEREVNIMEELKPTIFVMNQHMLAHLGYMMREMGLLRAYSCHPIERTIGEYRAAIGSWKEPGKNMENILFHKAGVKHCLGGWASRRRTTNRKTSNFEVASNDIAGPQLWTNQTRNSLAVVADECGMNYHNLVSSLACIWGQDSVFMVAETTDMVCITKMWKDDVVYRVQSSFEGRHVQANDLVVLKHLNEDQALCHCQLSVWHLAQQ
ncbi:hypothetical protein PHYBLDRAFT_143822 [Phycomyces blakesleeanus NRRL 1555(-)]|uniref:Uncharacterized protein n=1 Tax=Phycomyces blakesleeanus (strain ATCC 8743b / DSM 1359 / FGSC 10004 / NBRC 33097 / NRRL 1555) TaxID=763407 RepID=A0A162PSJ2_PHYB8|nr:hypothetical protein PHYBLDRAFT_143822 [Phycomyces blakesleeanus NRRL 1555(-)]OAD75577.1 hypothetical protein PHYBLDRAFT_143822 [Phycomyces blakesleeanus NRRL 1555(-)]|eukprot:XP_018293617.1 hypothetical protein PHYBLDRAFT_143822 [Phycomyces blakesleeanus NRRL 1555(-)]